VAACLLPGLASRPTRVKKEKLITEEYKKLFIEQIGFFLICFKAVTKFSSANHNVIIYNVPKVLQGSELHSANPSEIL